MHYDKEFVRSFFDAYGEREWHRLEADLSAHVNFYIHQHFLLEHIKRGDTVLETGAGAGRFTLELAALGAAVTVLDISPEQLRLNKQHVSAEGLLDAVTAWVEGDILDLGAFPPSCFDAVVCYGGPLSYVCDQADAALDQMLRVLRPGGHLFLSVMSLLGTTRRHLAGVIEAGFQHGADKVDAVSMSGDLTGEVSRQRCHMYRWSELHSMLLRHGCSIKAAAASGFLSLADEETLRIAHSHRELWNALLKWELNYCQEPGALDGGTHIIAVAQKGDIPSH